MELTQLSVLYLRIIDVISGGNVARLQVESANIHRAWTFFSYQFHKVDVVFCRSWHWRSVQCAIRPFRCVQTETPKLFSVQTTDQNDKQNHSELPRE